MLRFLGGNRLQFELGKPIRKARLRSMIAGGQNVIDLHFHELNEFAHLSPFEVEKNETNYFCL